MARNIELIAAAARETWLLVERRMKSEREVKEVHWHGQRLGYKVSTFEPGVRAQALPSLFSWEYEKLRKATKRKAVQTKSRHERQLDSAINQKIYSLTPETKDCSKMRCILSLSLSLSLFLSFYFSSFLPLPLSRPSSLFHLLHAA